MKSAWLPTVLLLAVFSIIAFGCTKDDDAPVVTPTPVVKGGKGGDASITVSPIHEGINVDSCWIYIKYDAVVVPFNNQYDDSALCIEVDGKPVATFSNLNSGEYYLYGRGWDFIRSEKVRGGLPYVITDTNARTMHILNLPVADYQ